MCVCIYIYIYIYIYISICDVIMLWLQQRIANTWLVFAAKLCARRHLDMPGPEGWDLDQVPIRVGEFLEEAGPYRADGCYPVSSPDRASLRKSSPLRGGCLGWVQEHSSRGPRSSQ